jgi:hypothetical protein
MYQCTAAGALLAPSLACAASPCDPLALPPSTSRTPSQLALLTALPTARPTSGGGGGYAWAERVTGGCSASCGGGQRTLEFVCVNAQRAEVPAQLCAGISPPPPVIACNTFDCDLGTYAVRLAQWSACSASCGAGVKTRTVECRDKSGALVSDSYCQVAQLAAARSVACLLRPCSGYGWVGAQWCVTDGAQTADACAPIIFERTVTCRDAAGALAPAYMCAAAPPEARRAVECAAGRRDSGEVPLSVTVGLDAPLPAGDAVLSAMLYDLTVQYNGLPSSTQLSVVRTDSTAPPPAGRCAEDAVPGPAERVE